MYFYYYHCINTFEIAIFCWKYEHRCSSFITNHPFIVHMYILQEIWVVLYKEQSSFTFSAHILCLYILCYLSGLRVSYTLYGLVCDDETKCVTCVTSCDVVGVWRWNLMKTKSMVHGKYNSNMWLLRNIVFASLSSNNAFFSCFVDKHILIRDISVSDILQNDDMSTTKVDVSSLFTTIAY